MKNIWIKNKAILMAVVISISILIVTTVAYFTSQDIVVNTINVGDVDIEVSEEFTPPESWDGKAYSKIVKIKNNSKSPALIRVALVPRWVDSQGNAWPGDTSIVTLNYATDNIISNQNTTPENKWTYGDDGYYYYNTIVPTEATTVEILNSVSANIPEVLKDRYKDKTLIVDVKAEAVQATTDAYTKTWSNIININIKNMLNSLCSR